jgi:hypothetical protein
MPNPFRFSQLESLRRIPAPNCWKRQAICAPLPIRLGLWLFRLQLTIKTFHPHVRRMSRRAILVDFTIGHVVAVSIPDADNRALWTGPAAGVRATAGSWSPSRVRMEAG